MRWWFEFNEWFFEAEWNVLQMKRLVFHIKYNCMIDLYPLAESHIVEYLQVSWAEKISAARKKSYRFIAGGLGVKARLSMGSSLASLYDDLHKRWDRHWSWDWFLTCHNINYTQDYQLFKREMIKNHRHTSLHKDSKLLLLVVCFALFNCDKKHQIMMNRWPYVNQYQVYEWSLIQMWLIRYQSIIISLVGLRIMNMVRISYHVCFHYYFVGNNAKSDDKSRISKSVWLHVKGMATMIAFTTVQSCWGLIRN